MHNHDSIKLLYWNAEGIKSKQIEFFEHLNENRIIVALIQETWLKPRDSFSHKDFNCYRNDRINRARGGVAIIVSKNLKHELLPDFGTSTIESIGIKVCSETSPISLVSAYFPGSDQSRLTVAEFRNDIRKLTGIQEKFFTELLTKKHSRHYSLRSNDNGTFCCPLSTKSYKTSQTASTKPLDDRYNFDKCHTHVFSTMVV